MIYWTRRPRHLRAFYHGQHYARQGCFPSCNPYAEGSEAEREFDRGWREMAAFLVKQMDIQRNVTLSKRVKVLARGRSASS